MHVLSSCSDCVHMHVFAFPVYLLVGLLCVLVVMETCCELPQMRRLRQRFYQESVRELDCETTNIIGPDHLSDHVTDDAAHISGDHPPVIPTVLEQAESLRQNGKSTPYISASGCVVNGELR